MAQRLRGPRARLARGARPGLQRHQLLQADRLGDARPGGRRGPGRRAAGRHLDRRARTRASSTATRASASPPATMRRSSGRCCAAWRRPSTTCCCASRCRGEEAERIGLVALACEEAELRRHGAARSRRKLADGVADRDPLDQVRAQQLAAHGGADLRRLARAGDSWASPGRT